MQQDNKSAVQRFYQEVINERNLELIDEMLTPDFIEHEEVPGLAPGPEGARQFFAMIRAGFPDFQMSIEDVVAEGDKVVVRSTLTGTHKGEFMGIPASEKRISVPVIDILRLADGKVAEHWGLTDNATMMQQLGAAPQ
jgi:steroid delta-isomerase-like uncharacterized protein